MPVIGVAWQALQRCRQGGMLQHPVMVFCFLTMDNLNVCRFPQSAPCFFVPEQSRFKMTDTGLGVAQALREGNSTFSNFHGQSRNELQAVSYFLFRGHISKTNITTVLVKFRLCQAIIRKTG